MKSEVELGAQVWSLVALGYAAGQRVRVIPRECWSGVQVYLGCGDWPAWCGKPPIFTLLSEVPVWLVKEWLSHLAGLEFNPQCQWNPFSVWLNFRLFHDMQRSFGGMVKWESVVIQWVSSPAFCCVSPVWVTGRWMAHAFQRIHRECEVPVGSHKLMKVEGKAV